MPIADAASLLRLPTSSVEALVGAGYLPMAGRANGQATIALTELKAFVARNDAGTASGSDINTLLQAVEDVAADPRGSTNALLDAIASRVNEMAVRGLEIFQRAFPDAVDWPERQKARFIEQARDRFEALLSVARAGDAVDDELLSDLMTVGAAAAMGGSTLPEVLLTLRISRDLVVQTAVDLAEDSRPHGGLALSLLLTQVLPAMDRLTDAVARGYWAEVVRREEESWARFEFVVEHSSDGIYEVDRDGRITYANQSLGETLGYRPEELVGRLLIEVLGQGVGTPYGAPPDGSWHDITTARRDGMARHLQVRVEERVHHGEAVGYDGAVRDVTAVHQFEHQRSKFLELITYEFRQPLTTILGLGVTLASYANDLTPDRVAHVGQTVRQQAERLARLGDDLYDLTRIEARTLLLSTRDIDIAPILEVALAMVDGGDGVTLEVEGSVRARADGRRLEQIVAHLVENALRHGGPPVIVAAETGPFETVIRVTDHGPPIAPEIEQDLFDHLSATAPNALQRGLGLPLARGLVEAMHGHLTYEPNPAGGSVFVLTLPSAGITGPDI